jgi:AcrR family transcriptional regulator
MSANPSPRRDQLLELTVAYMIANGAAGLSLRTLAEHLGISTFSFAYHFGAKAQLVDAVVSYLEGRLRARVSSLLEAHEGAPGERIIKALWEQALAHAGEERLLQELCMTRELDIGNPARTAIARAPVELVDAFLRKRGLPAEVTRVEASLLHGSITGLLWGLAASSDNPRINNAAALYARTAGPRWDATT